MPEFSIPKQTIADVHKSAEKRFFAGDLTGAQQELETALQLDDNAGTLWELLGVVAYTQSDKDRAISALEHASLLVPLSNSSQFILAVCYEKKKQLAVAVVIYLHLATCKNLDDNLLEPLARALGRNNECEAALQVCQEAAERNPDMAEPLMAMAFYMQRLQRPAEQIVTTLFRAFHLKPEDMDCRLVLAHTLFECGRCSEAAYLLSEIDIENCRCLNCLTTMQEIFAAASDDKSLARCSAVRRALKECSE